MTQEQETKTAKPTKKFSKAAFLESATTTKERLEYEVVLRDGTTYTQEEAKKLVDKWKGVKI